jgi:hypothetical protein
MSSGDVPEEIDEQNARNKKYKCMKALKDLIFSNPDLLRELKD